MHYVLDLPWGFKYPGVQYWSDRKIHVYRTSGILPSALRPYRSTDFSYNRWQEDELNSHVQPAQKGSAIFKPKEHQLSGAKAILNAHTAGRPGFLLADRTGLGKTLTALVAAVAIARTMKKSGREPRAGERYTMLVVCPKGVIPQWVNTLRNYPIASSVLRPLVINYHQLKKLLKAPAEAKSAKKQKTKDRLIASKGKPKVDWDFVIFDEAQYLKNYPSSAMSRAAVAVARLNEPYKAKQSPFVICSTATPGATPLNLAIMAPWLAPLLAPGSTVAKGVTPERWGSFLESQGFAVTKGKVGWSWASTPWYGKSDDDPAKRAEYAAKVAEAKAAQKRDTKRIGAALTSPDAPFIMRSPKDIAGWPEQQVIMLPLSMSLNQRSVYEQAWQRFRQFLRLPAAKRDSKTALVESLRYRQKSSLLMAEETIPFVIDWVNEGKQVFVSCEFIETIDKYAEGLTKAGIAFVETSGRNASEREINRLAFQKGQAKVVLSTVVEGVSFHAGETLPDGTKATSAARITLLHDVRQNNLNSDQALGRAHRDGQNSVAYIPFLEDTVQGRVLGGYANKTRNMKHMTGASDEEANELDEMYRLAAAETG